MDRLLNISSSPSQNNSQLPSHPFAANPTEILECASPFEEQNHQEFQRLTKITTKYQAPYSKPQKNTGDELALGGIILGVGWLAGGPIGFVAAGALLAACGGSSGGNSSRPALATNKTEGFQRIIRSDSYAGRLIVFLESGDQINVLNEAVRNYPGVKIERSVSRTTEEENRRRQELEAKTGKKFLDWNRVFYVEARDKATAERLQGELMATPEVRLVYPEQIKHGPSLATTPNLEGLQTYLEGSASAGLNISYAWDQGVYGAGVMFGDGDNGLNFDHEEFDLARRSPSSGGNSWGTDCTPETADDPLYFCTNSNVAHGTATMGMLHARHGAEDDRHGIRGIVPEAWATFPMSSAMPAGSIALYECATQYSWDGNVTCQEDASGLACVPCTSEPLSYAILRGDVFEQDLVTFITAGNGAINLDTTQLIDDATMEEICGGPRTDPQAADCWETSGVILVGASQGDRDMVSGQPQKQSYSNCGDDVALYGWGERVVTTSWHPESGPLSNYEWVTIPGGPNPPNDEVNAYFTNEFGGTSAAAAMVAGAATLVQSYFKEISDGTSAGDGSLAQFRYLKPSKLKEILVNSGVDAYYDDGCGIGKQPNVEEAFRLAEEFWSDISSRYPELATTEMPEDRLNELNDEGVGMVCTLGREDRSDPACPDSIVHPPIPCERIVPVLSKKMDIDEDGRGDLVSWTRGNWKIDLSTGEPADPECGTEDNPPCPEINDNYGSWDLNLSYPPVSDWEVPVVMDYDSDGKADLAIYDRENGRWNIALTSAAMLSGEWGGWSYTIDWPGVGDSNDYEDIWYTRPLPADYNGDDWTDLAVQTSDGHWKINFNWRQSEEGWSGCAFEENGPEIPSYADSEGIKDLAYLSDEELEAYPGWAYLPALVDDTVNPPDLAWRTPGGEVHSVSQRGTSRFNWTEFGYEAFGGMEDTFVSGNFYEVNSEGEYYGGSNALKTSDGSWKFYDDELVDAPSPNGIFGCNDCRPFVADLDGDGYDDRSVMCPEGWSIVYSADTFSSQSDSDGVRRIPLDYIDSATLPGCPVFGGLSYERTEQVRDYMSNLGLTNVPPFFDYAMTPYEYCDLPWFISDMPDECR